MPKNEKIKANKLIILYSSLALLCLILMFAIDWLFLVPATFLMWLNQRELFPKK